MLSVVEEGAACLADPIDDVSKAPSSKPEPLDRGDDDQFGQALKLVSGSVLARRRRSS